MSKIINLTTVTKQQNSKNLLRFVEFFMLYNIFLFSKRYCFSQYTGFCKKFFVFLPAKPKCALLWRKFNVWFLCKTNLAVGGSVVLAFSTTEPTR
jgi:hypothetical protein